MDDRRRRRRNRGPARGPGSGFLGLSFGLSRRFRRGIRFGLSLDGAAHFFRNVHRDRAGVSLLLRHAEAGQKVNDGLGFDFELAGQLVNSDLIGVGHAFRFGHLVLQLRIRFVMLFLFRGRWFAFGSGIRRGLL